MTTWEDMDELSPNSDEDTTEDDEINSQLQELQEEYVKMNRSKECF